MFESLYEWHYLARPRRLSPNTASALPEISDDGKTWTIRLTKGIYFTDDPAFKGKRRELVAEDDPAVGAAARRRGDPVIDRRRCLRIAGASELG